jgi:hypothetical protein
MVEIDLNAPRAPSRAPMIIGDTKEYLSPITNLPVDGRAARREEMAVHNVREVDPSEAPGGSYDIAAAKNPNYKPDIEVSYD